jgi:hypothetical protein
LAGSDGRKPLGEVVPVAAVDDNARAYLVGLHAVAASETFLDGLALLQAAEKRGLEGVVSKRCDAAYRSGECRDWRKVKTVAWREANRERWRLFERGSSGQRLRDNLLTDVGREAIS